MDPRLLALVGAALLVLLALKLRGPSNRTDLRGPPKRKSKRITSDDANRMRALVALGDDEEALRLIQKAGYDETEARKLIALVVRLEGLAPRSDPPPDPGWTEEERREDGLSDGRAFDYNPTLRDRGQRKDR